MPLISPCGFYKSLLPLQARLSFLLWIASYSCFSKRFHVTLIKNAFSFCEKLDILVRFPNESAYYSNRFSTDIFVFKSATEKKKD